ncbi:hypothetical protein VNO77_14426 [Canavalia gladiata]|uniref:Uncharacterized protein n=1 Tax=Canavalia gladiata TaxID=3824 RepID=A0AAN9QVF3_CANGL
MVKSLRLLDSLLQFVLLRSSSLLWKRKRISTPFKANTIQLNCWHHEHGSNNAERNSEKSEIRIEANENFRTKSCVSKKNRSFDFRVEALQVIRNIISALGQGCIAEFLIVFVMFYVCALNLEDCDVNPPITRRSAIIFLASYLSHAKFLSTALVASITQRLVKTAIHFMTSESFVSSDLFESDHSKAFGGIDKLWRVLPI